MPGVVKSWESTNNIHSVHVSCEDLHLPSTSASMKGGQRTRYSNGYNSDQQSESPDDSPRYLLEHLATFSVGPEFGLVSPKDGLRRLLQMEKMNGIWTQNMQMKLEKDWVIILDFEDGNIVERFPMNLISDPTAYTSDDPRELYNNILVFIVKEDPQNKSPNPSEMHIFQCARVYAQDVVDEMKMFMTGKAKTKYSENLRHLPPPPHNPPPEPPINGNSSKARDHAVLSASASSSPTRPLHPRGLLNPQPRVDRNSTYTRESNDETSSTTSEKYEREVTILNHCFDDIERFVVRLQHAAAAYKELERRQKNRKNKKKDMGDGMLSIRAKPPPEREFIDILQKFKLSFNLLAKLKSHIHDPNAPELVHFLFTPLALIIDAARDANHSANVAARVVSPLLTRDAIELLTNCCTSKETDLWHSLGDSWVVPRDQWKGYESSYHPVFSNGWAPENPIDENSSVAHRIHRGESELREQDYQRVFNHPERDSHYGSECFGSERGDDQERIESPAGIGEHTHVRPGFERQYDARPNELRRDVLERGSMLSPESDFHDARDRDVRSEFSSDSIERGDLSLNPQRQFDRQQMQWLDELKSRHAKVVQVVYPRTANNDKELTVVRGEILEVLDDSRKWWKARNMRGQVAHVPHTIVSPYPSVDDDVFNNPMYATRSSRESYYSTGDLAMKDHYVDEGQRTQESARSPPVNAPADWVRRERQAPCEISTPKADAQTSESTTPLPSPPPINSPTEKSPTASVSLSAWPSPPDVFAESPSPVRQIRAIFEDNSKGAGDNQLQPSTKGMMQNSRVSSPKLSPSPSLYNNNNNVPRSKILFDYSKDMNNTTANRLVNSAASPKENCKSETKEDDTRGLLQEELKASLTQKKGQKIWKKVGCPEHQRTECFYINQHSKSEDVSHWLQLKGFTERARDILRDMTGEMIFKTSKDQLEKYLGNEGARLYSNLLIQKNFSGFKTYTAQELASILEERRQKTET